ncbi:hypothetical protein X762_06660 [Mesorhizobium sp. LSHC426A00]|nr:hypothetical protein X766_03085 [Mesorhizobium sp. LSJC255A00]ESX30671.1 hypothetical protein X765_09755 [Mesorhizobium sp. LSHC440B00]ESX37712.1 hypothetical protein X763_09540 [Mesorhizobium sp. LSHC432A00]ESX41047.1 hypothetical protein X764_17620 [Mesorhizobium sp. LSHC440A00]ESX49704.1 hypothetical protein X761_26530 [Mesorhizobium sp. LSHC424B00]ESX51381.1 hypothetical protein X762_06660 [Mesorhizobium sp. LSHC426A00]ESX65706.1 hypothetical protein X758_29595 [Mesorhizobium sp. LSHC4
MPSGSAFRGKAEPVRLCAFIGGILHGLVTEPKEARRPVAALI